MKTIKDYSSHYSKDIPASEVRIFLQKILGLSLEEIILKQDYVLMEAESAEIISYIERRLNGEPVAYIIGFKEFYGFDFKVTKDVLIPRPETELIVDEAIKLNAANILDLCTGSGCIAISIAIHTEAKITASDISDNALMIAKENAKFHKIDDRITFVNSNWFDGIEDKFDLICCNPPYIPESDRNIMASETLAFEPPLALFAVKEGLEAYEIIAKNSAKFLNQNGKIILEFGYNQADKVAEIFSLRGFEELKRLKDIAGIERSIIFAVPTSTNIESC